MNVLFKLCTLCSLFYLIYSMLLYANMIMVIPKQCMTNVSNNLSLIVLIIFALQTKCGFFLYGH